MEMRSNVIDWGVPKHAEFTLYSDRIDSFVINGWPPGIPQKPHDLANAGMFYNGRRDLTICYHCGGGIHKWEPEDSPWIEHFEHYPNCGYLKLFGSNLNIPDRNSKEKQEITYICPVKMIDIRLIHKKRFKINKVMGFFGKCSKKDRDRKSVV